MNFGKLFDTLKGPVYTWYEDADLNVDSTNHVEVKGTEYWWEDAFNGVVMRMSLIALVLGAME